MFFDPILDNMNTARKISHAHPKWARRQESVMLERLLFTSSYVVLLLEVNCCYPHPQKQKYLRWCPVKNSVLFSFADFFSLSSLTKKTVEDRLHILLFFLPPSPPWSLRAFPQLQKQHQHRASFSKTRRKNMFDTKNGYLFSGKKMTETSLRTAPSTTHAKCTGL